MALTTPQYRSHPVWARRAAPAGRVSGSFAHIVVGVGASAGGLEAMLLMFAEVRPTGRVVYIVAQHMADGAHTDLVVRVIQRESRLQVMQARDGQPLLADHIFVIPAGQHGVVEREAIKLVQKSHEQLSTPSIDRLLTGIARHHGARGVGVVLSGAGWDGARGCRDLIHAGGVVLAQDPQEAAFSSMPEAAKASDPAVRLVKASAVGLEIARWLSLDSLVVPRSSASAGSAGPDPTGPTGQQPTEVGALESEELGGVIARIHQVTGIDFSEYRPETLFRRLRSRQRLLGLDGPAYSALLNSDPEEARRLQGLFLVSLSSFWRDRECFDSLAQVLESNFNAHHPAKPFKVWVPGCASGEEAYTLGALVSDLLAKSSTGRTVEVVGSDLNPQALARAREGRFENKSFQEAPSGWVERWFDEASSGLQVKTELAARVRFVLSDVEDGAPEGLRAGEIDLISCRNLMIYFHPIKQARLLTLFSELIRPGGWLFIGPAERLGAGGHALFRPTHPEHRIYQRTQATGAGAQPLGSPGSSLTAAI